jgi:hypothetical protein
MLVIIPAIVGKQLPNADVSFGSENVLEAQQWMVADVESKHLALERELGALVPVGQVGNAAGQHGIGFCQLAEQIVLAVRLVALEVEYRVHRSLVDAH